MKLRWRNHSGVMRLEDSFGHTRAFMYRDGSSSPYRAISVLGAARLSLEERRDNNKRILMKRVVDHVSREGY
jgi:hypothetical protein